MAIPLTGQGGKGSSPRKQSNPSKYAENWEKIFGNKNNGGDSTKDEETTTVKLKPEEI